MNRVRVQYVTGDATQPPGDGPRIIAHVCNDIGGWGSGFVLAVSARWAAPEERYREWMARLGKDDSPLGWVQFVPVGDGLQVANMVAQRGTIACPDDSGLPPVRYEALGRCLRAVGDEALASGASVHMPRIGCGLAGGKWELVAPVIDAALSRRGVPVTVYDLPQETTRKEAP